MEKINTFVKTNRYHDKRKDNPDGIRIGFHTSYGSL